MNSSIQPPGTAVRQERTLAFTKMHGLGNDFMVVRDGGEPPDAATIRRLADRRRGIGFDQLLWVEAPRHSGQAAWYRVYNADGGEVEQCGNGARCIASLVSGGRDEIRLGFTGGELLARIADGEVSVRMPVPEFEPRQVPFVADEAALAYDVEVDGERHRVGVVSMGNPHCVLLVDDVDHAPVERLGPLLERHERFPRRANIGFLQVVAPDHVRLRVYERGAGETEACGTGACAAAVIGRRWSLLGPQVKVDLLGGALGIRWEGPGRHVWMSGEAVTVYEGHITL